MSKLFLSDEMIRSGLILSPAKESDLAQINDIYNHYIMHSTASFDMEAVTLDERLKWYVEHLDLGLAIIVMRKGNEVVGFASLSPYNRRRAYRTTAEVSVYLKPDSCSKGYGYVLMEAILQEAKQAKLRCIVGLVCSENQASLNMLKKFDFSLVGELHKVGYKFERWLNVIIVEKLL